MLALVLFLALNQHKGSPVFSIPVQTEGAGGARWQYVRFRAQDDPLSVGNAFCDGLSIENDALRARCAAEISRGVARRQDRGRTEVVAYPTEYGGESEQKAARARVAHKAAAAPFALSAAGRAELAQRCTLPFTQRGVRLGKLRRRAADRGALSFAPEDAVEPPAAAHTAAATAAPAAVAAEVAAPVVPLLVLYRLHPRQVGGSATAGDVEGVLDVGVAATVGLGDALAALPAAQRAETKVVVFLNGFDALPGGREGWAAWAREALGGRANAPLPSAAVAADEETEALEEGSCDAANGSSAGCRGAAGGWVAAAAALEIVHCPAGNVASHACLTEMLFNGSLSSSGGVSTSDDDSGGDGGDDAVVLLLEDDYLLQRSALAELVGVFASHAPCFAAPYDGADRYSTGFNEDDGAVTVVAGQHRHWRTVRALSVTYAARLGTLRLLRPLLPHPLDDYDNSQRLVAALGGGAILTPLPGLASHIENIGHFSEAYVGLYYDYVALGQRLHARGAALSSFPGYVEDLQ